MSKRRVLAATRAATRLMMNPALLTHKILGRLRRACVPIPRAVTSKRIRGRVWFEFQFERYLRARDFRAFYTGSYELASVDIMRKNLRPGDIFVDVGANIGYMSALAASFVGREGEVHGFEPQTRCFARLEILARLNPELKLVMNHFALGDQEGALDLSFAADGGAPEATLVPGAGARDCVETVPVKRLDRYIEERIRDRHRIRMIKIDAEGYEFPVLRGLEGFFESTPYRPLIVCQTKPWTLAKLNYTADQFAAYMSRWSYQAFDTVNAWRQVDIRKLSGYGVVLFRANGSRA